MESASYPLVTFAERWINTTGGLSPQRHRVQWRVLSLLPLAADRVWTTMMRDSVPLVTPVLASLPECRVMEIKKRIWNP
jgi:hypothetical protein